VLHLPNNSSALKQQQTVCLSAAPSKQQQQTVCLSAAPSKQQQCAETTTDGLSVCCTFPTTTYIQCTNNKYLNLKCHAVSASIKHILHLVLFLSF
jgi:hypothetical protein